MLACSQKSRVLGVLSIVLALSLGGGCASDRGATGGRGANAVKSSPVPSPEAPEVCSLATVPHEAPEMTAAFAELGSLLPQYAHPASAPIHDGNSSATGEPGVVSPRPTPTMHQSGGWSPARPIVSTGTSYR